MRKTLFAVSMLAGLALAAPAIAGPYCDGYQAGYKAGFCEGKVACYGGTPNGCPGSNYAPDTYQAGYSAGYRDGSAAARRSR